MNKLIEYNEKKFETIKYFDKYGNGNAKLACKLSENNIVDHFAEVSKMVMIGFNARRKQNADPRKNCCFRSNLFCCTN